MAQLTGAIPNDLDPKSLFLASTGGAASRWEERAK
jgi:hypothetical protein